ncbi:MAG: hypothetical protein ACREP9_15250 [Candidatus Dormibacteraceae bacterium]
MSEIDKENTTLFDLFEECQKMWSQALGRGKQIKAKRGGKGGWQPMKHDDQVGSVRWTSIAGEALLPGQTPMCALCTGQDRLTGHRGRLGG